MTTMANKNEHEYTHPERRSLAAKLKSSWKRINAIHIKTYVRLLHNWQLVAFVFLMPVVQISLFGLAIGHPPEHLRIAVTNYEFPTEPFCQPYNDCFFGNLSCRYLKALDMQLVTPIPFPNREMALEAVKQGYVWASVHFPANYSFMLAQRLIQGISADDAVFNYSIVDVQIDLSNQIIGTSLQLMFLDAYSKFIKGISVDCELNPKASEVPVTLVDPLREGVVYKSNFKDFVAAGVILVVVFYMTAIYTTSHFIVDRKEGVLDRIAVAGVTAFELIGGLVLNQLAIMAVQEILVLVFVFSIFGVPLYGDVLTVVAICMMQGLCGLAFGFLVAVSCEDERTALQVILVAFYTTFILGGLVWPLEAIPEYLWYCSQFLPSTMAATSLRFLILRGYPFTHPYVWPGFASTAAWILIFMILTWYLLRRSKKP